MHPTIPNTTKGCPQYLKITMAYDTSKCTEWRRRYVYNGKNPLRGCCDGTKNRPCKMNCSRETTVTSLCPPRRLLCEVPLIIVIGPFLDSVSTHFYIFFPRHYYNYYTIITFVHTNSWLCREILQVGLILEMHKQIHTANTTTTLCW